MSATILNATPVAPPVLPGAPTPPLLVSLPRDYRLPVIAATNANFEKFEFKEGLSNTNDASAMRFSVLSSGDFRYAQEMIQARISKALELTNYSMRSVDRPDLSEYVRPPLDEKANWYGLWHCVTGGQAPGWASKWESKTKEDIHARLKLYFDSLFETGNLAGFNVVLKPDPNTPEIMFEIYGAIDIEAYSGSFGNHTAITKHKTKTTVRRVNFRVTVCRELSHAYTISSRKCYGGGCSLSVAYLENLGAKVTETGWQVTVPPGFRIDMESRYSCSAAYGFLFSSAASLQSHAYSSVRHDQDHKLYMEIIKSPKFHPDLMKFEGTKWMFGPAFNETFNTWWQANGSDELKFFNYREHGAALMQQIVEAGCPELRQRTEILQRFASLNEIRDAKLMSAILPLGLTEDETKEVLARYKAKFTATNPYIHFVGSSSPFTILEDFKQFKDIPQLIPVEKAIPIESVEAASAVETMSMVGPHSTIDKWMVDNVHKVEVAPPGLLPPYQP